LVGDDERAAVMDVLQGHVLTHGSRVEQFESEFSDFTGAPHAVAVNSCTAALHLAYLYMGLGENDEVIVPAQTHVAAAHAVELCGARCVFVDCDPRSGNVDLDQLERAITARTRALSLVHFLGVPVDMTAVGEIAGRHDLPVVEDCALAVGATWDGKHVGLHGDVGAFSFYPIKHITTAEGGMLITRHPAMAEAAARQRAFGIDRNVVDKRDTPGHYDVVALGHNYRLTEIAAAMGVVQMQRLPDFLAARRANHATLSEQLAGIDELELLASPDPRGVSGCYCLSVLLDDRLDRTAVIRRLQEAGVGSSVYYPRPLPALAYFQARYGHGDDDFPGARRISHRSVALPVGPHLEEGDVEYIASTLKEAVFSAR
jgi:dTDP-4-amino-4,6-dideoxygalactose transaminase